jgi:hypothetical protein
LGEEVVVSRVFVTTLASLVFVAGLGAGCSQSSPPPPAEVKVIFSDVIAGERINIGDAREITMPSNCVVKLISDKHIEDTIYFNKPYTQANGPTNDGKAYYVEWNGGNGFLDEKTPKFQMTGFSYSVVTDSAGKYDQIMTALKQFATACPGNAGAGTH